MDPSLSRDTVVRSDALRRRLRRLAPWQRRWEACEFLRQYHQECDLPERALNGRVAEALRCLRRDGFYEHTPEELEFGARLAWRNHARCIGRLYWRSLEVLDRRAVVHTDEVAATVLDHLRQVVEDRKVRNVISIFAPVREHLLPATFESRQLTQYAGYLQRGQAVLGDPLNVEVTRTALALGWQPPDPPGRFDLLPWILRDPDGRRVVYAVPDATIPEVRIEHPACPSITELDLRWYAVPFVSSMILTIGGIDYPCAPFNGHYLVTEIASRNLGDERRYGMLPAVAARLGLDPAGPDPMWRDAALLELNRAVLHSFRRDGWTIVDHHSASDQFMSFVSREHAAGRSPSADWAWVVPPQASSACSVYHLPMTDARAVPNFYGSRTLDGSTLGTVRQDREPTRWGKWAARWRSLRLRFGRHYA